MENHIKNGPPRQQISKLELVEKLYEKAKAELARKRIDKAREILEKSESIHSTHKAKELLQRIKAFTSEKRSNEPASSKTRSEQTSRPAGSADSGDSGRDNKENFERSQPGLSTVSYTDQQLKAVRRVMRCKNYYEIFEVTYDAPDEEIKIAYKKLALILHPDKNSAPEAEQAMQEVNKASKTLLDPNSRRSYDTEMFQRRVHEDLPSQMASCNLEMDTTGLIICGIGASLGLLGGLWLLERGANRRRQNS